MEIRILEVDVDALQLLPETSPVGLSDVQLGCGVTNLQICRNGTCNAGRTCGNRTIVFNT